jgi:sugar phosphate isomerase/epimerase
MTRLLTLWRARPWLTSAFLSACALTLFFAGSFAYATIYWATHQNEPVRPWMTVGYVARSWGLDGREIDALANLPLPEVKGHPQTLKEIAADRGVPVSEVIAEVEAALATLQARKGAAP